MTLLITFAGGITSGWFCLESTILALAISGTALSFYLNRTTDSARKMFRASLLYLPVFMSGLLLHRLPLSEQNYQAVENSHEEIKLSSSSVLLVDETENVNGQNKVKNRTIGGRGRGQPPVAYASVAPFPFLPAPAYVPQ